MSFLTFFRQTSWLAVATVVGGVFSFGVHFVAQRWMEPAKDYSIFLASLEVLNILSIPVLALQATLAQMAAKCLTEKDESQLDKTIRWLTRWMLVSFAVLLLCSVLFRRPILSALNLPDSKLLWFTLGSALVFWISQVFTGLLQGRQDFAWLGWTKILFDLGRCIGAAASLAWIAQGALGAVSGLFWGSALGLCIPLLARWRARDGSSAAGFRPEFPRQFWPLTLALGASTLMMSTDMLVIQKFLTAKEASGYGAARVVGKVLLFLTAPLTLVMFPKIVQSAARSERTAILGQALIATLGVCGVAAMACTLLPALPLRISGTRFLDYAPLVPQFAWAILPLVLSNVLISNLLAREKFKVVYFLVAIVAGYAATLWWHHPSKERVILVMGLFNSLLLITTLLFTFRQHRIAACTSADC